MKALKLKAPRPITLARVQTLVGEAVLRAPLFYIDSPICGPRPIQSVAVHTDIDGTISVVLAGKPMENRIIDPQAREAQKALDGWRAACELAPELADGEPPDEVLYTLELVEGLLLEQGIATEPGEDVFEAVGRVLREVSAPPDAEKPEAAEGEEP